MKKFINYRGAQLSCPRGERTMIRLLFSKSMTFCKNQFSYRPKIKNIASNPKTKYTREI